MNFDKSKNNEFHIHSFTLKVQKLEAEIDIAKVVEKLQKVPSYLFWGIENVVIDRYIPLVRRGALAVAEEGNMFISSLVDSEEELYSCILHELAHRLIKRYSDLFSDKEIEKEFLAKREYLYGLLDSLYQENNLEHSYYRETKYNKEFDRFLISVGYDKLTNIVSGLFVSPYAITSLDEYFTRNFEEYFSFDEKRKNSLTIIAPAVYNKLSSLIN